MIPLLTSGLTRLHLTLKGVRFGARGGSCTCDPCDCNPCTCADSRNPDPPLWRVSGCFLEAGFHGEIDLSQLVLLSLAQPDAHGQWAEVLYVDQRATDEQIATLLALFEEEEEMESLPAEIGLPPRTPRAIYRAPLTYHHDPVRPLLHATLTREQLTLVRAGEQPEHNFPPAWTYAGPMALRGAIER